MARKRVKMEVHHKGNFLQQMSNKFSEKEVAKDLYDSQKACAHLDQAEVSVTGIAMEDYLLLEGGMRLGLLSFRNIFVDMSGPILPDRSTIVNKITMFKYQHKRDENPTAFIFSHFLY